MQRRAWLCQTLTGATVPACSITVYLSGTTTKALIYGDQAGSSSLANPISAGTDGTYTYYAPSGRYTEVVTAPGFTFGAAQTQDFILHDPFAAPATSPNVFATTTWLNATPVCTNIPSPTVGKTFCFDQTANQLKAWNGSNWVAGTVTNLGVANIADYGAKLDVKTGTDGAMTSGSANLTSSLQSCTAADVGKRMAVAAAGAANAPLRTTIASCSGTTFVLSQTAGSTVSGKQYSYGTDDTTAFQAAINAFGTTGIGTVSFCGRTIITTTLTIGKDQQISIRGCGPSQGLDFVESTPAALIDNQSSGVALDLVWSGGSASHTEIVFADFAIDSVADILSKPFPSIAIRLDHFQANSQILHMNIRHHDIGIQCTQTCFDYAIKASHFENLTNKAIYIASHGSQALYEGNTIVKIDLMAMDLRGFGVVVRQNDWEFIGSDGTNRIANGCLNGCVSITSGGGFIVEGNYWENNGDLNSVAGRSNLFISGTNGGLIAGNYGDPVCSAGPACTNPMDRNVWLFNSSYIHIHGNHQNSQAVTWDLLSSGTGIENYQWGNSLPGAPNLSGFKLTGNRVMFASGTTGNGIGQDANFTWNGTSHYVGGTSVAGSTPTFGVARSTGADFAAEIDNTAAGGSSYGLQIVAGGTNADYSLLAASRTQTNLFAVKGDGSVTVAAPTGGGKGLGTVNASSYYIHGTAIASMPLTNASGTVTNAPHIVQDTVTLSGGTAGVALAGAAAFTNATSYTCVADDDTAIAAVRIVQNGGNGFTVLGTGSDVVRFICIGS